MHYVINFRILSNIMKELYVSVCMWRKITHIFPITVFDNDDDVWKSDIWVEPYSSDLVSPRGRQWLGYDGADDQTSDRDDSLRPMLTDTKRIQTGADQYKSGAD